MELTESARKSIIEIKDYYEEQKREADKEFFESILRIIKQESKFYWHLKYELSENPNKEDLFMKDRILYFSIDKIMLNAANKAKPWIVYFNTPNEVAIQNIFVLYELLNECAKFWQIEGSEDYPEINRLFKSLYEKAQHLSIRKMYKYYQSPLSCVINRTANVDAFNELSLIYHDSPYHDVPEAQHISFLSYQKPQGIVTNNLKEWRIKNDFDSTDIPLTRLIDIGFPLDKETFDALQEIINKFASETETYDQAILAYKNLGR